MDTKFSIAIHVLILISESPKPLSSEQMARSAGTNASYVRKVLAALKRAGIVSSRQGVEGYALAIPPDQLPLLRIYQAVSGGPAYHLIDIHQNPSDQCIVGRHIKPTLTSAFANVEEAFARALEEKTLAGCITDMRMRIQEREVVQP
ncbi:Rrf2 family transcriptional regulator [Adlercreutzia sp. ZJ473]|uniref:Rrf2 family transcriptional regulator n=1 Tax=Adlercreutzia sp. ZJ473 TaxID=2722822 RepID=UPI0015532EEF|nr:Rrf2 family transcriptional regulator [Adlercreutzia sp. ZJ473]